MAENYAELLFVHEDSRFVEFHAADGDQPASVHRRGYFFMMFFFGRDYQYLVDVGHVFYLPSEAPKKTAAIRAARCYVLLISSFCIRPDAARETLISTNRCAGRSMGVQHTSTMKFRRTVQN
jgi:hypothetical protein